MRKADGLLGHSLGQMGRKKGVRAGEIPSASGEWRLKRERRVKEGEVHAEASVVGGACPPERARPVPDLDSALT